MDNISEVLGGELIIKFVQTKINLSYTYIYIYICVRVYKYPPSPLSKINVNGNEWALVQTTSQSPIC